jgi:hypothetical protein
MNTKGYKLLIYTLAVFVLSTAGITAWYIEDATGGFEVGWTTVKNIVCRYGMVGGGIAASFFFLLVLSFRKVSILWIRGVVLVVLLGLLLWAIYLFAWYFVVSGASDNPFVD